MRFLSWFFQAPYDEFLLSNLHIQFSQYTFAVSNQNPEH
jgi:hypothetical protein